jgi:acetyl-CoA C-acetyltransferase
MKTIYVVDGARTPFLKAQKRTGAVRREVSDLATQAGRALLLRQPFSPE